MATSSRGWRIIACSTRAASWVTAKSKRSTAGLRARARSITARPTHPSAATAGAPRTKQPARSCGSSCAMVMVGRTHAPRQSQWALTLRALASSEHRVHDATLPAAHRFVVNGLKARFSQTRLECLEPIEVVDAVPQITKQLARASRDRAEWHDQGRRDGVPDQARENRIAHKVFMKRDAAVRAQVLAQIRKADIGLRHVANAVRHENGIVRAVRAASTEIHRIALDEAHAAQRRLLVRDLQHAGRLIDRRDL